MARARNEVSAKSHSIHAFAIQPVGNSPLHGSEAPANTNVLRSSKHELKARAIANNSMERARSATMQRIVCN